MVKVMSPVDWRGRRIGSKKRSCLIVEGGKRARENWRWRRHDGTTGPSQTQSPCRSWRRQRRQVATCVQQKAAEGTLQAQEEQSEGRRRRRRSSEAAVRGGQGYVRNWKRRIRNRRRVVRRRTRARWRRKGVGLKPEPLTVEDRGTRPRVSWEVEVVAGGSRIKMAGRVRW